MTDIHVDALARLLDGDPTLNGEATAETRDLGQLAHVLATSKVYPTPKPRPEFTNELRAALVEAAREEAPAPSALSRLRTGLQTTTARWRRSTRMATATGAAALALSSGGLAVAAERALPSDVLYPAKLALEEARLVLVRDEVRRGDAHLDQAANRIAEAEAVVAAGDQRGAARALLDADDAARTGAGELIRAYQERSDVRYSERLVDFSREQSERVDRLDDRLAGDAADAGRVLAIGLARIEARMATVTGTCPGCDGVVPDVREGADLSEIPPAHEPFEACPCEDRPAKGRSRPAESDTADPEPQPEPAQGTEDASEDPAVDEGPPSEDTPPAVEAPDAEQAPVGEEDVPPPPEAEEPSVPDLDELPELWHRWRNSDDTEPPFDGIFR